MGGFFYERKSRDSSMHGGMAVKGIFKSMCVWRKIGEDGGGRKSLKMIMSSGSQKQGTFSGIIFVNVTWKKIKSEMPLLQLVSSLIFKKLLNKFSKRL